MSLPWHEEAVRLRATGLSYQRIADAVGRAPATVREFLNPQAAQERLERKRLMRRSNRHRRVEAGRNPVEMSDDRSTARSYMRADPTARARPSLPVFSLPAADPEPPRVFRLVPKTRLTSRPGAERWRETHRRMIREGRANDPTVKTLVSEFRQ